MFPKVTLEDRLNKLEERILCKRTEGTPKAVSSTVSISRQELQELMLILKDLAREIKTIKYFG